MALFQPWVYFERAKAGYMDGMALKWSKTVEIAWENDLCQAHSVPGTKMASWHHRSDKDG